MTDKEKFMQGWNEQLDSQGFDGERRSWSSPMHGSDGSLVSPDDPYWHVSLVGAGGWCCPESCFGQGNYWALHAFDGDPAKWGRHIASEMLNRLDRYLKSITKLAGSQE